MKTMGGLFLIVLFLLIIPTVNSYITTEENLFKEIIAGIDSNHSPININGNDKFTSEMINSLLKMELLPVMELKRILILLRIGLLLATVLSVRVF